ncbi:NifU family protein [Irregularibacter muris]|uniref:NifU family protein n=1 Tax=Irregularibacter muris TaxID=1796619 RepID=A0AAE3L2V4_9FIRM|nr:NifU family protein [Irregularibacter muris]MCR1899354.1 NifU family protein [Irregularibacter muris]
MLKNIQEVLERDVRPYLLDHYGDVEITSYEDGILYIRLLGQCNNCPSAKFTVENIIESKLKENIPELKEVILDTDISSELYHFAKEILGKSRQNL